DRPHLAVACDAAREPGLTRLLLALAELAVAGVPVDVRPLFDGRAERLDLAALPVAAPGWRVNGHLVRTHDGEPVSGGLQPADRIPEVVMDHGGRSERLGTEHREHREPEPVEAVPVETVPVETVDAVVGDARAPETVARPVSGRDGTVLEYLRSMQQIVDAQRAVMLSYLAERSTAMDALLAPAPETPATPVTALVAPDHQPGSNGHGPLGAGSNGHDAGDGAGAAAVAWSFDALAPGSPSTGLPAAPLAAVVTPDLAPAPAVEAPAAPAGPVEVVPAAPARPRGDELLATILAIVGDRTGYPLDMLDPDLDLEADLSIDSIKRIEIIGELADRVGLPGVEPGGDGPGIDEAVVEELAQLKTLRSIVRWLDDHADEMADAEAEAQIRPASPAEVTATAVATAATVLAPPAAPATGHAAGVDPAVLIEAPAAPALAAATPGDARSAAPHQPSPAAQAASPSGTPAPGTPTAASTTGTAGAPTTTGTAGTRTTVTAGTGGTAGSAAASGTRDTIHVTGTTGTAGAPGTASTTRTTRTTGAAGAPGTGDATRSTGTAGTARTAGAPGAARAARTTGTAGAAGTASADDDHQARVARNVAAVAARATGATPPTGRTTTRTGDRPAADTDPDDRADLVPLAARRFVLETVMLAPALPVASAAGKTIAVVSDPWDGLGELCNRLERAGATVEIVPTHRGTPGQALPEPIAALLAAVDGVVHLGAADPAHPVDARDVFAALQPAIAGRATTLVAAVAPRRRAAPG
ncbi:MAG TPA: phosphopantetheine-binding protein, partial [Acidimicrobiales bacterium]|nr:phosphopantetheine-binding protein [Acidimicrobiales bacterium]